MNAPILKFVILSFCIALVSGFAGHGLAQSGQAWKITSRQSDALAATRIGGMLVHLHGKCTSGSPHVTVALEGYRGNALGKTDQVDRPVVFVAEGRDGSRVEHRGAMFLFGDEVAMPESLPAGFVERLAESDRLLIRNLSGQPILTVSLAEAREFPGRLARLCGTANAQAQEAQAASGRKTASGLSAGQHCFVNGYTKLKMTLGGNGDADFDLITSSPSNHVCGLAGRATPMKAGWRYSETLGDGTKCSFDILIDASGNVRFDDKGAICKRKYCGERAFFEDVTLGAKHRRRC